MLILDGEEEEFVISNLRILKLYFKTDVQKFEGFSIANSIQLSLDELNRFLQRIEEDGKHETNEN